MLLLPISPQPPHTPNHEQNTTYVFNPHVPPSYPNLTPWNSYEQQYLQALQKQIFANARVLSTLLVLEVGLMVI
jgi:hypothetical protein